jgi:RND family efflux transporter MFP subunit
MLNIRIFLAFSDKKRILFNINKLNMKFEYIKKHSTIIIIISILVVVIAGIAARAVTQKTSQKQEVLGNSLVQLLKVKDYAQSSKTISTNGTVESLEQVDLRSLSSGKITSINAKVGDQVKQGHVLAIVDQSVALATLTSARGGLAQAQAAYKKLLAGASDENIALAQATLDAATSALENTKKQQQISVDSAYRTLLNTALAAEPDASNTSDITLTISGTYNSDKQGEYRIIQEGKTFYVQGMENLGNTDLNTGISTPKPLGTKGLYVQFPANLTSENNKWTVYIPNTKSAYYTQNNNIYQAALQAKDSSIAAAKNAVTSAQAALNLLLASATSADMQAAQALILTAQGQEQAAKALYENTFIKAPFAGKVSSFLPKLAELVQTGQKVASIVNVEGLLIKVYVSGQDLPYVKPNSKAEIGENKIVGTVTNIAPSVDETTRTAEVDISVIDPKTSGLTVGQNTAVTILGSLPEQENLYIFPLQSIKIDSEGKAFVFTLDANHKAVSHEVNIGKVNGEKVEVKNGVDEHMEIVSNAYEVSDGDTVLIQ